MAPAPGLPDLVESYSTSLSTATKITVGPGLSYLFDIKVTGINCYSVRGSPRLAASYPLSQRIFSRAVSAPTATLALQSGQCAVRNKAAAPSGVIVNFGGQLSDSLLIN